MSGFAGNGPRYARGQRFTYVVSAGATGVSGADALGLTLNYQPGYELVILNGFMLPRTDYTAADGSTITGLPALAAGDVVEIYASGLLPAVDQLSRLQNGADIADKAAFKSNLGAVGYDAAQSLTIGQKAQAAANIGVVPVAYKVVTFTRVMSTASGNQSITGVGFTPRLIQFQAGINGGSQWGSMGQSDGTTNSCVEFSHADNANFFQPTAGIQREGGAGSTNYNTFSVASMDADGFTLSWTKTGSPTLTASVTAICYR